jgi:TolA-binding protein
MKRLLPLVVVPFLLGCSGDSLSTRYRAERDVWRAERELERLNLRPQLTADGEWRALSARFAEVGERYADVPVADGDADAVLTRTLAAEALGRSAGLLAALGDTTGALTRYAEIEERFAAYDNAAAGAALAAARLRQASRDFEGAYADYGRALQRVEPASGRPGPAGEILRVPLTRARLRAMSGDDALRAGAYAEARAWYTDLIAAAPGTREEAEARSRLIDLATDERDWAGVVAEMRRLETALRGMEDPPQDPAEVRSGIAEVQRRGLADAALGAGTLRSLVEDYPESRQAARALVALAQYERGLGDPDAALGYLDTFDGRFAEDLDLAPAARLERGRALAAAGRWTAALEVFRSLPVEHPLSEAALDSHLEIVAHYDAEGKAEERGQALDDAEAAYREFLDRYPSERYTPAARERLTRVLLQQRRWKEAVDEMVVLAEALPENPARARLLWDAGRIADERLDDAERASRLFREAARLYPDSELGRDAARRAADLEPGS